MKTILAILLLILILSSCAVSKPEIRTFKVIDVQEKTFLAKDGRLEVVFFKVDCDSVWKGKTIMVSKGNKIR